MGLYPSAEAVEKGIRLDACKEYIRAWPGGTGSYKLGANYGMSQLPVDQVWLIGRYRWCSQKEGFLDESMAAWPGGQYLRGRSYERLDYQAGRGRM